MRASIFHVQGQLKLLRLWYHGKDEIEDEFHFLFSFKAYKNLRHNLPHYDSSELHVNKRKLSTLITFSKITIIVREY